MKHDPPRDDRLYRRADGQLRFGLSGLLFLVALVAVVLALVTQLQHVGCVASLFVVGMTVGWWFQRWRLAWASFTGFVVFAVTYLASWYSMGYGAQMDRWPFEMNWVLMREITQAIRRYEDANATLPDSLGDLASLTGNELRFDATGELRDYWGHPFYYHKVGDRFELMSRGRDGNPGGVGLDADLFLTSNGQRFGRTSRLPFKQFLFETPGSGGVFVAALFASFATTGIWYVAHWGRIPTRGPLIASIVLTIIAAVLVALFLAVMHVASVQSGH
jgi:hypothetical protein